MQRCHHSPVPCVLSSSCSVRCSTLPAGNHGHPCDVATRRELRLGPPLTAPALASEQYELRVELTWLLVASERSAHVAERTRRSTRVVMEGGVVGIARVLGRIAMGHRLTVSVPDSRQYILLSRK